MKGMEFKKLAFGVILFLLVGGAFAGALDYYGKIEGTADVEGPIFYANLTGENPHQLLLNQKPSSKRSVTFSDGSTLVFKSEDLGGVDLEYTPKCEFSVKVNSSNSSKIKLTCYNSSVLGEICSTSVSTSTSKEVKTASCSGDSPVSNVKNVIYEIQGEAEKINYTVETSPSGDTKLQVTKK